MADIAQVYSSAQAWLNAASIRFARRATDLIAERTRAGAEIGIGFVPTDAAIKLATSLAQDDQIAAAGEPELLSLGDIPIARLIERTGLPHDFARWAALMLLVEQDHRWSTLLAWLGDDAQARVPTAGLLTEIAGVAGMPPDQLLGPGATLRRLSIIRESGENVSFPDQKLQFSEILVPWLLGHEAAAPSDPSLAGLTVKLPDAPLDLMMDTPDIRLGLARAAKRGRIVLTGGQGRGRSLIANALFEQALVIDARRFPGEAENSHIISIAMRDACLNSQALVILNADTLGLRQLVGTLDDAPVPVALTSGSRLPIEWPTIEIPKLDHARSLSLWKLGLGETCGDAADRMAHQFRLGAIDILHVCEEVNDGDLDRLNKACLARSANTLDQYAAKVECRHLWDDLVLPARQLQSLKSIVQRTRHGHRVFEDWGFAEKLAPNRGLTAMFSGPSGAGKTLSASIVARELGLPLYRVDLSATVSKYIGETEKQLEQIFSGAEAGSACLFFDECDALFGKRSEVSDAHDRYANIETSYLLQRLETHRGIVFMASNYPQNIDDAFTRRIDFTVEFPMPDAALRAQLWERLLPPKADAEIDALRLGEQFELSGGSIRNCLLAAAFLAAEEECGITMAHCLQAVAQEYEKTGRPLTRSDFGESFGRLRPPRKSG